MTYHFAHMAPPGAVRTALVARWVRCSFTQRLVLHWDRAASPVQPEPLPATLSLTGPLPA